MVNAAGVNELFATITEFGVPAAGRFGLLLVLGALEELPPHPMRKVEAIVNVIFRDIAIHICPPGQWKWAHRFCIVESLSAGQNKSKKTLTYSQPTPCPTQ